MSDPSDNRHSVRAPDGIGRLPPREAALAWFVRMNSGEASAEDRGAFEHWVAADPLHRMEYDRLGGIWQELDSLPDPRRQPATERPALSRRRLLLGGAVMVAAGAGMATLGGWPAALAADHRTGTGERRTLAVQDGSQIDLDAGSAIAMDFTAGLRRVNLIEGRARFTVARDAARPFEVICGDGAVRAPDTAFLGTAFVIHRRASDVMVSVQENAVSISQPATGPVVRQVRVGAGQRLAYGMAGLGAPEANSPEADTAWLRGKLVFEDRPLQEVVADIDRYRTGRIMLWDDALASLRVSGIFDMDRPDAAFEAIIRTLPVQPVSLGRYLTVLRPA